MWRDKVGRKKPTERENRLIRVGYTDEKVGKFLV